MCMRNTMRSWDSTQKSQSEWDTFRGDFAMAGNEIAEAGTRN